VVAEPPFERTAAATTAIAAAAARATSRTTRRLALTKATIAARGAAPVTL
jgi:hypothetical protein